VGIGRGTRSKFALEPEAGCGNEPCKRLPARVSQSPLDPRYYRLRRPGASGQVSLAQSRPFPRLAEEARSILTHAAYDS
jgi:hypothetical protein